MTKSNLKKLYATLVEKKIVAPELLNRLKKRRDQVGGDVLATLIARDFVPRSTAYWAAALALNKKYLHNQTEIDYYRQKIDVKVVTQISLEEKYQRGVLPLYRKGRSLWVMSCQPGADENIAFLKKTYAVNQIKELIITDHKMKDLFLYFFRKQLTQNSSYHLRDHDKIESAHTTFTRPQIGFFIVSALVLVGAFYWRPFLTARVFLAIIQFSYSFLVLYKLLLAVFGMGAEISEETGKKEIAALPEKDLPIYTILIPLFREANLAEQISDWLKSLDYPPEKLDIIILLEEEDRKTIATLRRKKLPAMCYLAVAPGGQPQTKPRACNFGLFLGRGEHLTIYDAEDFPEPDQLKKAFYAFNHHDSDYICFQAALNYYNSRQNLLTRFFTIEYSYWFDYMLPGLFELKLPIPLGGTSNHFKTRELRKLGGWDPFNTTEDADLGIRSAKHDYKIGVFLSTTHEEASSRIKNWIRQRSRWIKGYMQTALVHNRKPWQTFKELGFKEWFSFQFFITGTPIIFLLNPLLLLFFIYWLLFNDPLLDRIFTPNLLIMANFNFLIGNFFSIYLGMIGVLRRKNYSLAPLAVLNPLYWLLHSVAAYKALHQMYTTPFFWEKTEHGFHKPTQ